jgi:hypothetical protein
MKSSVRRARKFGIGKIGYTCRFVPFNRRPWPRVGDYFGGRLIV